MCNMQTDRRGGIGGSPGVMWNGWTTVEIGELSSHHVPNARQMHSISCSEEARNTGSLYFLL